MTSDSHDLDIRLSAYLDDELPDAERKELERLIAADPATAARLEELSQADSDFDHAAREIDSIPMSASLTAVLDRLESSNGAASTSSGFFAAPAFHSPWRFLRDHRAIAASVAVAAGAVTLQTAIPTQDARVEVLDGAGTIQADSGLGKVLDASASGATARLPGGLSATPRFTFEESNGYCRVVDITGARSEGRMVACRTDSAWRVTVAAFSEASETSPDAPYRTASSAAPESIEAYLDAAMKDAPLSTGAETELIRTGWTQPAKEED
ncbi:hypothetical protein [Henriciella sp.]|uniref:anti-sigma factor family protein n=1 Tax=Henriciella sp. TaxID=1968823 RepID=UPI00263525F9|nr:hypothetical protein [Henriciella sp.]